MITYLPRKRQTFIRAFTYKMAAKNSCIDVEQNYATVTLYKLRVRYGSNVAGVTERDVDVISDQLQNQANSARLNSCR